MKQSSIWVIIPAYDEEKRIKEVIRGTKKYIKNIIVVDDGSKDKTYDVAKKEGIVVLKHIINLGKGAALKTGCEFALDKGAEFFIVMDADSQHEPKEIPKFLNELKNVPIVLGFRRLSKDMPIILKLGNNVINKITKLLYGIILHDTQCGYRAFSSDAYRKIKWKASDYSMESEIIANIGKKRLKYKEIPIKTIYEDRYKGTTIIDGIKIVLNMFWWRLSR